MAKMNWRKRRNKFAAKSGKGREVWKGIFLFFIGKDFVVCIGIPGKGQRDGGRGGGLCLLEDVL